MSEIIDSSGCVYCDLQVEHDPATCQLVRRQAEQARALDMLEELLRQKHTLTLGWSTDGSGTVNRIYVEALKNEVLTAAGGPTLSAAIQDAHSKIGKNP